jgi:hypothetical protein
MKRNVAAAGGLILLEDLGAGDIGRHQIRRELDALERQVQRLGERRDQQRLRQPGHADEQRVTAREQRDEQLLDHAALADDALADLGDDLVVRLRQLLDGLEIGLGDRLRRGRDDRVDVGIRLHETDGDLRLAMDWCGLGHRFNWSQAARSRAARPSEVLP